MDSCLERSKLSFLVKMPDPVFDTHCHLDDLQFDEDCARVIRDAQSEGVVGIINPGSDLVTSRAAVDLAHKELNVFAGVGLHPHTAGPELDVDKALAEIDRLAADAEVIALGEFGLDTKHSDDTLDLQKVLVREQLGLAAKHSLPIILHVRDHYDLMALMLEKHGDGLPGVVHSFTGDPKEAQKMLEIGLYIAIGGIITFEKGTNALRQAAKDIPLDRLLLETDAPYLTPEPRRGKRNEPSEVATVARFIADLRGIPYAELASTTTNNARTLFSLPDAIQTESEA